MGIGTNGAETTSMRSIDTTTAAGSPYSCRCVLFAEETRDALNNVVLSRRGQSHRARQTDRLPVERVGIRARRAAGGVMSRRAMYRLPERTGLDFLGSQFAEKLTRADAGLFFIDQHRIHPESAKCPFRFFRQTDPRERG